MMRTVNGGGGGGGGGGVAIVAAAAAAAVQIVSNVDTHQFIAMQYLPANERSRERPALN